MAERRRRVLLVLVAVALVIGAGAAVRVLLIARDLVEARDQLDRAAELLEDGRIEDARAALVDAESILVAANGDLRSAPEVTLAGLVPVVRQNVAALRETIAVALDVASHGRRVIEAATPLADAEGDLEVPLRAGAVPLDVVDDVLVELEALRRQLRIPDDFDDPSPLVAWPLASAQERIAEVVEERSSQVADLTAGLGLVQEALGGHGDRRYLLAIANTAEMRGSGGMYLTYGVLESSGGDVSLGNFGSVDEIFLAAGVDPDALGVPSTELGRWQGLEPTRLWRNVNLIPEFATVAPRAAVMFEAATGLPVDGVIQIDPHGLAAFLAGIGPVEVEGLGTVDATNVVALTLNEAYIRFPDRDQRQEVLGDVAEATFRRLVDGEYPSLRPLGEALLEAVAERHVLFWSARPDAALPIAYFAADGPLPAGDELDHVMLTTQNRGRDKLDYYLDTDVVVAGARPAGEYGHLDVTVTLTNTAPPGVGEPAYIFGGDVPGEVELGTYTGIVSLYTPNGTSLEEVPGGGAVRLVAEGDRTALTWDVAIPAGGAHTVTFRLRLPPRPPDPYTLQLVPVPRVRPTTWTVQVDAGAGRSVVRERGALEVAEALAPS